MDQQQQKSFYQNKNSFGPIESEVSIGKIFTGKYWDEFSLPLFYQKKTKNLLLLGAGLGAGLAPILHLLPHLELVCVDADASKEITFREVLRAQFFESKLEYSSSSAEDFVARAAFEKREFDIVWIDLFTDSGYATASFSEIFWQNIKAVTHDESVIAFNLFGIPAHLFFYSTKWGETSPGFALLKLARRIQNKFNFSQILPSRNNTTLMLSQSALSVRSKLTQFSIESSRLQALRCQYPLYLNPSVGSATCDPTKDLDFVALQMASNLCWEKFLEEEPRLKTAQGSSVSASNFRDFAHDEANYYLFLESLKFAMAAPVLLASDAHRENNLDAKSFVKYVVDNYSALLQRWGEEIFFHFLLQNAWSICLSEHWNERSLDGDGVYLKRCLSELILNSKIHFSEASKV